MGLPAWAPGLWRKGYFGGGWLLRKATWPPLPTPLAGPCDSAANPHLFLEACHLQAAALSPAWPPAWRGGLAAFSEGQRQGKQVMCCPLPP